MALIECKYCKAKISDRALSCPKCGKSQISENIGFLKAYKKFYSNFLNIKPLRNSREFWFGFLFSQIINLALLIIGTSMPTGTPMQDICGVSLAVHFFFSSFALLTLSIRRIRGGGKSGFLGIFYLIFIFFCLIIFA